MIVEDYVSFETAKLLKEKGFDESVGFVYSENGELMKLSDFGVRYLLNSECDDYSHWQFQIEDVVSIVSAPTIQMAIKWLRKKHNIHIEDLLLELKAGDYGYAIQDITTRDYIATSGNDSYNTPEEACEAAIKYCLKNLI